MDEITLADLMQTVILPIITTIMGYLTGKGLIKICVKHNGKNDTK